MGSTDTACEPSDNVAAIVIEQAIPVGLHGMLWPCDGFVSAEDERGTANRPVYHNSLAAADPKPLPFDMPVRDSFGAFISRLLSVAWRGVASSPIQRLARHVREDYPSP